MFKSGTHTTNVVCFVINVITDLMHPALTLFTLYPLKCVLVFTRRVFLETKMHTLGLASMSSSSGIWQISPLTMNFPFFLCRKGALLLLIQFIRWKQLCFQVLMVRSNDRQSLSHWYCRSNVLQCCIKFYGVFCWGTLNQLPQFSNLIKCIKNYVLRSASCLLSWSCLSCWIILDNSSHFFSMSLSLVSGRPALYQEILNQQLWFLGRGCLQSGYGSTTHPL